MKNVPHPSNPSRVRVNCSSRLGMFIVFILQVVVHHRASRDCGAFVSPSQLLADQPPTCPGLPCDIAPRHAGLYPKDPFSRILRLHFCVASASAAKIPMLNCLPSSRKPSDTSVQVAQLTAEEKCEQLGNKNQSEDVLVQLRSLDCRRISLR
jgi:hypothetical protein